MQQQTEGQLPPTPTILNLLYRSVGALPFQSFWGVYKHRQRGLDPLPACITGRTSKQACTHAAGKHTTERACKQWSLYEGMAHTTSNNTIQITRNRHLWGRLPCSLPDVDAAQR